MSSQPRKANEVTKHKFEPGDIMVAVRNIGLPVGLVTMIKVSILSGWSWHDLWGLAGIALYLLIFLKFIRPREQRSNSLANPVNHRFFREHAEMLADLKQIRYCLENSRNWGAEQVPAEPTGISEDNGQPG